MEMIIGLYVIVVLIIIIIITRIFSLCKNSAQDSSMEEGRLYRRTHDHSGITKEKTAQWWKDILALNQKRNKKK